MVPPHPPSAAENLDELFTRANEPFYSEINPEEFEGKDTTGKVIDIKHFYPVKTSTREIVEHQNTDGTILKIPHYAQEIAKLIQWAHENNIRLIPMGGQTSSGLFKIDSDADTGDGVQGIKLNTIAEITQLRPLAHIHETNKVPSSITVPANATIHSINALLLEQYPEGNFIVDFDITTDTSSQVGPNWLNGALGDSRNPLPVDSAIVVDGDGYVRNITDPQEIDAYRGTHGYAGMATQLTLRVQEVPPKQEIIVLPLVGKSASEGFLQSYPQIAAELAEYMHQMHPHDVWIRGAEILDSSGMKRIIETEQQLGANIWSHQARQFANTTLGKNHGAVLLNVRHDFPEGESIQSEMEKAGIALLLERSEMAAHRDDPDYANISPFTEFHPFIQKLARLIYETQIIDENQFKVLTTPAEIQAMSDLREHVPLLARQEAGFKQNYSRSMDRDVVIRIKDKFAIAEARAHIQNAIAAILTPSIEAFEEANAINGIRGMLNGHLLGILRELTDAQQDEYFNGGFNIHLRLTGDKNQKETIDDILNRLNTRLTELEAELNQKYQHQGFEVATLEGEKKYPHLVDDLKHLIEDRPDLAKARFDLIEERGHNTLNFRIPSALKMAMATLKGKTTEIITRLSIVRDQPQSPA